MSQKGFAPILIVLVGLIVAGVTGIYYFGIYKRNKSQPQSQTFISQTPTPTSTLTATPTTTSTPTITTTPSSNENVSWKTYTNTKYGIKFSYPPNLKPGKYTSDNGVVLLADFSDDQNNELWVWAALDGGVGHGGDFSMKQVSNDGKLKVDNYDATLIIWETDPSSSLYSAGDPLLRRYSVVLNSKAVIIELTDEKDKTSIDQLNQIISTFRFIK